MKRNEETDEEDDEDEIVEDSLKCFFGSYGRKVETKSLKDFDEITKKFKKLQKYNQELKNVDKKNEKKLNL